MRHCSSRPHLSGGGFTLVEILIAIFILSLVLATVYVSYTGTLKTSHQLEKEGEIYKMARQSLERLAKDLTSLQMSEGSFYLNAEKKKQDGINFTTFFLVGSPFDFRRTGR